MIFLAIIFSYGDSVNKELDQNMLKFDTLGTFGLFRAFAGLYQGIKWFKESNYPS